MNWDNKFHFEAKYEPWVGEDPDTCISKYGEPITIRCRKEGKKIDLRNSTEGDLVNAMFYMTDYPIVDKSKVDGQVVKLLNSYPPIRGRDMVVYEFYTWSN